MSVWESYWDTTIRPDGWVMIDNLTMPAGLMASRAAFRDFRQLEREIAGKGLKGWLTWTRLSHSAMLKILEHLQARPYGSRGDVIFYYKEVQPCVEAAEPQ